MIFFLVLVLRFNKSSKDDQRPEKILYIASTEMFYLTHYGEEDLIRKDLADVTG